jgi:hypothetical protein
VGHGGVGRSVTCTEMALVFVAAKYVSNSMFVGATEILSALVSQRPQLLILRNRVHTEEVRPGMPPLSTARTRGRGAGMVDRGAWQEAGPEQPNVKWPRSM